MAMKLEEIEALIETLAERGFKSSRLSDGLYHQVAMNQPYFKLPYQMDFAGERMNYKLAFEKNKQEKYELRSVIATHRHHIDIEDVKVKGIGLTSLDRDMAAVDWESWWRDGWQNESTDSGIAGSIMSRLGQLTQGELYDGLAYQQLLMYKHWPEYIFDAYSRDIGPQLGKRNEHTYEFKLDEWPSITASLAYHIQSEHLDSIADMLEGLGLNRKSVIGQLHASLTSDPASFVFTEGLNTKDGYLEVTIPVEKIGGWYEILDYAVTLNRYPEITHGIFNGVDSERLAKKYAAVNWKNDGDLFNFYEDREPEIVRDIELLEEELFRMALVPEGKIIADHIMLGHYQGATFFEDRISDHAWALFNSYPKFSHTFPPEITIDAATNLLMGRAVFDRIANDIDDKPGIWIRLDLNKMDRNGNYKTERLKGIDKEALEEMVSVLPTDGNQFRNIHEELLMGSRVEFTTTSKKRLVVEADPIQGTMSLFTKDGRPVPFNFHFDPDWKPDPPLLHQPELQGPEIKKKSGIPAISAPVKKKKGKGL
jgi:hypothetical protein